MVLVPPIIAEDDGIRIWMYFEIHDKHKLPHVHVFYDNNDTVYALSGEVLEGSRLKGSRHKRILSFLEKNHDAPMDVWANFRQGNNVKENHEFNL